MAFSTTIKRKYWDMKMEDFKETGKFYEYKEDTPFWRIRLAKLTYVNYMHFEGEDGVFLVGSEVHRVKIREVRCCLTRYIPPKYKELIKTKNCWYMKCVPID